MKPERPNIILIDAHDLGTVLACYGWKHVPSPHIDRLASEGALFTDYFATAPICIPSRAGIYAGVHPGSVGCYGQDAYDEDTICIARLLREHGYSTYLSGWNVPNPTEWAGYQTRLSYGPDSEYTRGLFREYGSSDQPFFAHFSFALVHRPYLDTYSQRMARILNVPAYLPDTEMVRRDLSCLYHRVGLLDMAVGRILDGIRENGLGKNTIIVFTTDHGPAVARAKHTLYDSGIRTALIIRNSGTVEAGRRHDALLSNVDLMPTLLEMAGLPVPVDIHGSSFLGLLSGKDNPRRTKVYAAQTWGKRAGLWYYTPARCIRTERYKLIRNFTETPYYIDTDWLGRFGADRSAVQDRWGSPSPSYELYDLQTDPWELHNLADETGCQSVHKDLGERLDRHLARTGDRILDGFVPNRGGKPEVPLWERQSDGTFHLRAYNRMEGSDVPFGEPLIEP